MQIRQSSGSQEPAKVTKTFTFETEAKGNMEIAYSLIIICAPRVLE